MTNNFLNYYLPVFGRLQSFVALIGVYFLAAFAAILVGRTILGEITINGASAMEMGLVQKHSLLQTETWLILWFNYLLGIAIMIAVAAEQQAGMLRMQIMTGLSRQAYGLRIIAIGLFLGIFCNWLVTAGLGLVKPELWMAATAGLGWKVLIGQALFSSVYILFALLCVVLLERALAAAVAFVMIPLLGESIVVWLLERYSGLTLSHWFPFSAAGSLVPLPYQLSPNTPPPEVLPVIPAVVAVGCCGLFAVALLLTLQRRDL